jgi:Domain of unknown function (DUF4276)
MSRVGIIVDGDSEYAALPLLIRKIPDSPQRVVATLLAPIPPKAGAAVIARACKSRIDILLAKRVAEVIVVLDREDREECSGQWALTIRDALDLPESCRGSVVLKDRMFENWLLADVAALRTFPVRYSVSDAVERRIVPNKADRCDALRLIKDITNPSYSKTSDSKKILSVADPLNVAANSRSFRRLMRVLRSESYRGQSKLPA